MRALERVVEELRRQNREIAEVLCSAMDIFVRAPTPQQLQVLLDVLREGQMACEDESTRLRAVCRRRRSHYIRLRSRRPGIGPGIGQQYALVQERQRLVRRCRRLLRQVGDAVAWVLLNGNPRLIAPLYAPQSHRIPRDEGLAGALLVQDRLHRTGRFLVLENDLVRCVGTADLLVVPVNRIGFEPLVLELKSTGEVTMGGEIGVSIGTAHSDHPMHEDTYRALEAALRGQGSERAEMGHRGERQMETLGDRTRQMFELNRTGADVLRRPTSPHWRTMENVVNRAMVTGSSWDLAEDGVYKWAVRNAPGDDLDLNVGNLHRRLHGHLGISTESPYATASTVDLALWDELSVLVRPVALWELSPATRALILAGEVVVGNLRRVGLLEAHLGELGIRVSKDEGRVVLARDGDERMITGLEFSHIEASISLTGMSPRDVARSIDEGFVAGTGPRAK